jgi:hypothetical protein
LNEILEPRSFWKRLGASLLIVLAATFPASAQTAGTTTVDTGFQQVEVDLAGQLFNEVLPFDVPFIMHGNVPQGVTTLEVRCWKLATSDRDKDLKSGEPVTFTPTESDGNCWKGGPLVWRNTIDSTAPTPTFRLLVPRLDAESYYTFRFSYEKKVTADQAKAFEQQVQQVVSSVLWGNPTLNPRITSNDDLPLSGGPLSDAELHAIYDQLVASLKAISGADRVVEPGSIFADDADFAAVAQEFNLLLRPIREDQGKITDAITDYRDAVANANRRLAQLRTDPALAKLQGALTKQAATDSSVQHFATTVTAALAVPDLPVLAPDDRKDPDTLTSFVTASATAVADASAKLAALADLLATKLTDASGAPAAWVEPLVASSALTTADLEALKALGDPRGTAGSAARLTASAGSILQNRLQRQLDDRTTTIAGVAGQYRTKVEGIAVLAGSTTGNISTEQNNYVSADTGLAYAPEIDEFPTYVGTNIYFRPVNKAAPLDQFGPFFSRASLGRRVSVTIGLTAKGIGDDKTRKDLFNTQTLVLGLGARMTNSIRLTAGSLVFLETDPNPLVDDDTVAVTPFVSLSFDIDVVPTLQGIGGLFK